MKGVSKNGGDRQREGCLQPGGRASTLVALGAWWIWKHRNSCVFEGSSPSVVRVVQDIKDEEGLWCLAGAFGLSAIWP
jgi:hypothetical protein